MIISIVEENRMRAKYRESNFVAVGHFTHDVTSQGYMIGGSAAYSSITVRNLGLHSKVVTSVGTDFDPKVQLLNGIDIKYKLAQFTTKFNNIYQNGYRQQFLLSVAETLSAQNIPVEWQNTEIAYICPVANEVTADVVHIFTNALIGVTPQGWMRRWDKSQRVYPKKWGDADKVLPYVDALILSEDDIAPFPEQLEKYIELTKIVVLTRNKNGARLYMKGKSIDFPAYKTTQIDPTGAGDVFAAAFLVKYNETHDAYLATDFANCVASFAVECKGIKGIPTFEQIKQRFRSN